MTPEHKATSVRRAREGAAGAAPEREAGVRSLTREGRDGITRKMPRKSQVVDVAGFPAFSQVAVNLAQLLRHCRMVVCEAYVSGGSDAALAAVASGSIRLYRHVAAGDLLWKPAFRHLLQVSVNLGLVKKLGKRAVRIAIYAGPRLYSELAAA